MPFIEGDDELLGECTQAFLEASQECKDLLSQLGNGLEVDAAAPSRLDFWTPLETDGNCNLDSAFRIIERCRRPNKKFNSEEVIFQVLLDPDCWLNNGSATIGQTSDAIRTLFETLLRRVTSSLEPTDLIRAIIFSEHLDRPISTHLMLVSEMSVEKIMACATKVLQSKSEVRLDEGFNIEIITIRRPVASGNAAKLSQEKSALKVNIDVRKKRCPSCKKTVSESHMCYLQKEPAKKCNEKLIFFDFETDQTTGEHVVNFAVAQYLDGTEFVCEGYDAIDKFCKYLFSPQHKGFTAK
ncbi:uncharacterized protein TNCV_1514551 [Trichonephila clavipes]|nr:uncharacterized protein TNCV_1514551 [Trichonephila clavipes]